MSVALITGISGQDGSYLAKFLLDKGYHVWGAVRSTSQSSGSLDALRIRERVALVAVDFFDQASLYHAIQTAQPDEIYNLAAQSSVAQSFKAPVETGEVTALGAVRLLQAMKEAKPDARFFQAASSEMFGVVAETPQSETTPFHPRSPYGAAKVYAHSMTINYREAYNCHASNGILFNHESPLRPEQFVTRKVTMAAARIKYGLQSELVLGNLDVERDWGFAGNYVEAMWRVLQQDQPDDYVIATGKSHSLRYFVECAFSCVGLDYRDYVRTDPIFYRPAEAYAAVGSTTKTEKSLGWKASMTLEQLVEFMVQADLQRVQGNHTNIQYLPSKMA
jgi:GDPmannose 4,6-dehydratase